MSDTLTIEDLDQLTLEYGAHDAPQEGVCLLEAVAWLAGEKHSDHPKCVSRVLSAYGRRLNDGLSPADRQKLKPFIPRLVGTAGDGLDEHRRHMAVDWAVRTAVPRYLDIANLPTEAAQLRALAPVTDDATRKAARAALAGIRDLTWDARKARRQRLRELFAAEFAKNPPQTKDVAVAVAVAAAAAAAVDADAVAVAVAAADADAVAVAVAAAAADAAAVAAADAAAVDGDAAAVDADAAAAAAADAVAVDVADAAAAGVVKPTWGDIYWAVRRALREKWAGEAATGPLADVFRINAAEGIDLLDRMIAPTPGAEAA